MACSPSDTATPLRLRTRRCNHHRILQNSALSACSVPVCAKRCSVPAFPSSHPSPLSTAPFPHTYTHSSQRIHTTATKRTRTDAGVGAEVGAVLGACEGAEVGIALGVEVGASVGAVLGANEGVRVGAVVGLTVPHTLIAQRSTAKDTRMF